MQKKFTKPLHTVNGFKTRFMEPGYHQRPLGQDTFNLKQPRARSVTWVCLPYFSLEKYSGISSATASGDYPFRTLNEARHISVRKERDMMQAVCRKGNVPKGICIHIGQIWCLILDDSLLITCARVPADELKRPSINVRTVPPPASPTRTGPGRVIVRYGECVMWCFELECCGTWFALLVHFAEFWPRSYELRHNGKVLSAEQWSFLHRQASVTGDDVQLDFQPSPEHRSGTYRMRSAGRFERNQPSKASQDPRVRCHGTFRG